MARLTIADLQARAAAPKPAPDKTVIRVGMSTCGLAAGAEPVFNALTEEAGALKVDMRVARTGCAGMCSMEPLVEVQIPGQAAVMFGDVTPEFARSLFLNYADMTNDFFSHPQWYNAITHNCTTEIFTFKTMKHQPHDWRILLNGKADQMEYEQGELAGDLPFAELKQRAYINPAARAAGKDPQFSEKIREGRPGFSNVIE